MHVIWNRYSRSGSAPPWFYVAMAVAFVGLAVWALVSGDWLVAGLAAAMIAVVVIGGRFMRRLGDAASASAREARVRRDEDAR